ncbi:MAG: diacylglycerol kinase family lipid kinase [Chloroflexota bacterium]|nr:diacylglycerol kinase family lipid kinase [Chloroflexota bacterium]
MPDLLLIVNPRSANGATGRHWHTIEQRLRSRLPLPFDVAFTERPGHATAIARQAADRYGQVVALGGDGTVNEVVNGLIADNRPIRPDLALGIIPRGTGADFVRTLGIPRDLEGAVERLAAAKLRQIDVGKVRYHTPDGTEAVRYFINEASIGVGAAISDRVNRSSKMLGGRFTFLRATLATMLRYQSQFVTLCLDGGPAERALLTNVWIANGAYSGGGIHMAPRACLDDGLLDVVRVGHLSLLEKLTRLRRLYSGTFAHLPKVAYVTARRIEAESEAPVPIETDGEAIGTLPATFELIGERLNVIA